MADKMDFVENEYTGRGPVDSTRRRIVPALGQRPELNGVRGIAALLVVGYHFGVAGFSGGFLGVDVFFALSGFLITTLLFEEWHRTGTISIKGFYIRRVKRLLPPLLLLLVVLGVSILTFDRTWLVSYAKNAATVVTYSNNLMRAHVSGQDTPFLGHLWSLSIEEQFYLLWPLALILILRRTTGDRWRLVVIGVITAAFLFQERSLFVHGASWSRLYFGSDSRIAELLVGCLVATVRSTIRFPRVMSFLGRTMWPQIILTSALGLEVDLEQRLISFRTVPLFALVALTTALLSLALVESDHGPAHWLLASRPLDAIGKRSYEVYLWHFPVCFYLLRLDAESRWARVLLWSLACLVATELSRRLIVGLTVSNISRKVENLSAAWRGSSAHSLQ